MKISPLAQGSGAPAGIEAPSGPSASPDKVARAKAIASGLTVTELPRIEDAQADRAQNSIKKIKMKTQRSVYRDPEPEMLQAEPEASPEPVVQELEAAPTTESNILDVVEETKADVSEDTKPLSPQFAALAKAKRDLQTREKELLAREQALKATPTESADNISLAKLKSNPLAVLEEQGFSRDQIAEMLLSQNTENNPAVSRLEQKIQALEEKLQKQNQTLTEKDKTAREQSLNQLSREAQKIVAMSEEYEMVQKTNSIPDVIKRIEETFDKEGYVMDVEEALKAVEEELLNEALEVARIKKVQSKLTPAQTQQLQNQQDNKSNVRVMRTLTNRDGASIPSSARERAIAAFHGRKT